MSQVSRRAVPLWPIVNFGPFGFDTMSLAVGAGAGAVLFYILQKFVLKRCMR